MQEENQKQNWKQKQNWNQKRIQNDDYKYQKNQKYVNQKKEETYYKSNYSNILSENFVKMMKIYPDCFQEQKISLQDKINIPMEDCLLKILKNDQKPTRKKSDQYKQHQEKKFEKYQKKEPYDNKILQEDEKEPEWMMSIINSPNLNDFQLKTLEYDFKKTLDIKRDTTNKIKKTTNDELLANLDYNQDSYTKQSPKIISPKNPHSENSSDNDICFEQLLEKSQKKNSDAPKKIEIQTLETTQIFPQLEQKCSSIYQQNKEYNKIKLFIDFTRQMTKQDINENIWYYEDPQKKIQGPFSSVDMDVWNLDQYFPSNLQISWKQNKTFISIQQFKNSPIQILKLAFLDDANIIEILQVDKQEIKKPQGFENYNQNQNQNVQIFSDPNYQITHNNFQISQNNFQVPIINSDQQKQQLNVDNINQIIQQNNIKQESSQNQQKLFEKSLFQTNNQIQFVIQQNQKYQDQVQIQQKNQQNSQIQNFNQQTNQKKMDIQEQPQLLSNLQVLNDVKQDNFQNISEIDLKKILGIEKNGKNFFDFS